MLNDGFVERFVRFVAELGTRRNSYNPMSPSEDGNLAARLFCEYENRRHPCVRSCVETTASDIKARSLFFHERALIFARPSQNTMNLHVWLETIFGLDVLIVHEPQMFNEWLFRHVASVDFLIVEQDSFTDQSTFSRFMAKAREVADDLPLIVMASTLRGNDFEPSWHDPWDISLRIPVSQISCWMTVKTAANLTLNGRL